MIKNMKKVPIIIAQIMGKWVGGGVEATVMNYYRNLDRTKIQFDFICDSDSTNIPFKEINKLGGRVFIVNPYQDIVHYQRDLKKLFLKNKYKIVHSHINTLSFFSLQAAKKANVPIRIAHSHSTTDRREWRKNLLKQFLKFFSKVNATHYFACGEYAARFLFGNKTFESGKCFIMKNAIDLNNFVYNVNVRNNVRKKLNVKDKLVIGHVGRFVEQKNHEYLIEIFNEIHKQNKESILILVGQGPLEEKMKNKIKALKLEKSVRFLGQRNDVEKLYQAFDILVLPSLYEGLAVVGVEAQVAGLFCVFSENITKELKILDSSIFISLKDKPKDWAFKIIKNYESFERTNIKNISNYDIKREVLNLENKYIELMKE